MSPRDWLAPVRPWGGELPVVASQTTPDPSPEPEPILDQVDDAVEATFDVLTVLPWVLLGAFAGIVVSLIIHGFANWMARRHPVLKPGLGPARLPLQVLLVLAGAWIAFAIVTRPRAYEPAHPWRDTVFHIALVLVILAATWLIASLVRSAESVVVQHFTTTGSSRAKRVETQFQIIRRVVVGLIWVIGVAGVLMTFPSARTAGASLFASAGLLSVVAGLAAQTTLGNVFAGLQVAFTDSLRVDDVVIINGDYSVVEEITLTYVVLKVWDGRRLIVPSSKLTTEMFENWTRRAQDMMGKVELDVDWRIPIAAMRTELNRALQETDLWDGRTGVLQVSDATGGRVRVAALVSAKDSSTLTDLRNYLRERLVVWVQEQAPLSIPYQRTIVSSYEERSRHLEKYPDPVELVEAESPAESSPEEAVTVASAADAEETVLLPQVERISVSGRTARSEDDPVTDTGSLAPSIPPITANVVNPELTESQVRAGHESSIFTGSPEAEARAEEFSGPGEEVLAERERKAEAARAIDTSQTELKEKPHG